MKKFIVLIFLLYGFNLLGQEKNIKAPEYVIIANNEIITEEKLEEYGKQGLIKGMNKGVTEDERIKLAKRFGDKIGDKEFIINIELLNEKEKAERLRQPEPNNKPTHKEEDSVNEFKLNINDAAPNFTVEMLDAKKIALSDLKGKVVLLNYWATWCAPCLMEFAQIPTKILEKFKDKKFVFIPISIGESKEIVKQKMSEMRKYGVTFNVGIDPSKKIWNEYATGAIPKSFVIDQNGIIKYVSIGNADGSVDKLAKEISNLLAN
jgi:peroxiredoxin